MLLCEPPQVFEDQVTHAARCLFHVVLGDAVVGGLAAKQFDVFSKHVPLLFAEHINSSSLDALRGLRFTVDGGRWTARAEIGVGERRGLGSEGRKEDEVCW